MIIIIMKQNNTNNDIYEDNDHNNIHSNDECHLRHFLDFVQKDRTWLFIFFSKLPFFFK